MNVSLYLYIFIMFAVIYLIRMLPLTLIRGKIKSRFLRSFLYYVPYITLSVMIFPAIIEATANPVSGIIALIAGIVLAFCGLGLFPVAVAVSVIVFLCEKFL
jgi:branched-subunit amino acid transport protein